MLEFKATTKAICQSSTLAEYLKGFLRLLKGEKDTRKVIFNVLVKNFPGLFPDKSSQSQADAEESQASIARLPDHPERGDQAT